MLNTILPSTSGIYEIRNTINNKVYVGSAVNLKKRKIAHKALLNRSAHHSIKLQRAWNKYGENSFAFYILENVQEKTNLIEKEQYWIDTLMACGNTGYNMLPVAGSRLGYITSDETKKKLAKTSAGNSYALGYRHTKEAIEKIRYASVNITDEVRLKMSLKSKGRRHSDATRAFLSDLHKGMKHTEEKKLKISKVQIGKVISLQTREKLRNANLGKTLSAEHKEKIALSLKGVKHSADRTAKVSASNKGRKLSEEHKDKLRMRKLSAEHKEKLRIANTGRKPSEKSLAALAERNSARDISVEQRKQISEKLKGRKVSEEALKNMTGRIASEITRKKMTDAQKLRWEKVRINAAKQNTI